MRLAPKPARFALLTSAALAAILAPACRAAPGVDGLRRDAPGRHAGSCPSEKLAFDRETACRNDGSVELCIPAADAALLGRIQALAPDARTAPGAGRARCVRGAQLLVLLPTEDACRHTGKLSDAAWGVLCRIAEEPAVSRIVPTWYE